MSHDPGRLRLAVPVKGGRGAKSRLNPPAGLDRAALAHALAEDTLTAVAATGLRDVVVVTSDAEVRAMAGRRGLTVVADPGAGLNAAVRAGWALERPPSRSARTVPRRVAALLGDLPALAPDDLLTALTAALARLDAGDEAAFVPDASGVGTVLLVAADGDFIPLFGPGSARAHARVATRLDLDLPRLRQDVDTAADLRAALALGVGAATQRLRTSAG